MQRPHPPHPVGVCALFSLLRSEAPYLLPWLCTNARLRSCHPVPRRRERHVQRRPARVARKLLQLLQRKAAQSGSWLTMKSMAAMGRGAAARLQSRGASHGRGWAGNWDIDEALVVGGVHASDGKSSTSGFFARRRPQLHRSAPEPGASRGCARDPAQRVHAHVRSSPFQRAAAAQSPARIRAIARSAASPSPGATRPPSATSHRSVATERAHQAARRTMVCSA